MVAIIAPMDDTVAPFQEEPSACPFVALEDDRDRRSDRPDYRHRCFASRQPEPRAFPHQERYCLSRGFTECPIFLDWAHRESAAVVGSRRSRPVPEEDEEPAGAALAGGAAGAAAAAEATEAEAPAFLASRRASGRAAGVEEQQPAPRPEEGLWGPADSRQNRGPVVAKARANVKHPDWEDAPRQESYPRIRDRSYRFSGGGGGDGGIHIPSIVPLAVIVVVAALLAFLVLPGVLFPSGSGSTPKPSVATSPTPAVTPSPTPVPKPTPFDYIIKSGDTLTSISAKFNVSIEDILAANPDLKNPDSIAEGQTLHIPAPGTGASPSPSAKASPTKGP